MPLQRVAFTLAKGLLFALVVWGIILAWREAEGEMRSLQFRWQQLRGGWLLAAGLFYAAAQVVQGLFWHRILKSMGQHPGAYEAVRAFFIGHLGKYVPGKLFVVIIRTALVRSNRTAVLPAGTSVFLETFFFMAVGAALAALVLLVQSQAASVRLLALCVAAAIMAVTCPPVWSFCVRHSHFVFERIGQRSPLPEYDLRMWSVGWLLCTVSWLLCAASLGATLCAIPLADTHQVELVTLGRWLAAVATSVVAGFLSFLPGGGIGVREWVLDQLLATDYGPAAAILSALLLRAVWLVTEVVGSAILYLVAPK